MMKAQCPHCEGTRNCEIKGHFKERWSSGDGYNSVDGCNEHYLLQCLGCETVFYQIDSSNSEDWDGRINPRTGEEEIYHPVSTRVYPPTEGAALKPEWVSELSKIDWQLFSIVDQVYEARERHLIILAAVGLRTAFDRATEVLGVEPGKPLSVKVSDLVEKGLVGAKEAELLNLIVEAGNAAAHRAWAPDESEIDSLLEWLERFLVRSVVRVGSPESIKDIPARAKSG